MPKAGAGAQRRSSSRTQPVESQHLPSSRPSSAAGGGKALAAAAAISLSGGRAGGVHAAAAPVTDAIGRVVGAVAPQVDLVEDDAMGFFVYGTLRPDDDSGAAWTKSFCDGLQAEAAILPGASLYVESFPAVSLERTRCSVRGVLLRVPAGDDAQAVLNAKLREADKIEGYPDLYDRSVRTVQTISGAACKAYVYHRTGRIDRENRVRIPDGDWLSRRRDT